MATNITSTALDFDNIKDSLKDYLKKKTEFTDYDFDGSGLSNILDVLAYNTHFNGLIANLATNESFIHTAQLRSSLVSHAESLGYDIRSKTSSQVTFDTTLNLTGVSGRAQTYTLPIGTIFVGSNEEGSHNFITREIYTATDDGTGLYTFKDVNGTAGVTAFEGTVKTKTFFVGQKTDRQIYIIPDSDIDTNSAIIRVFDSPSSDQNVEYTPLSKAITVNSKSTYYTLREAPNGTYELNFGDGITFGKTPEAGSRIVVTYARTIGEIANGCKEFTTTAAFNVGGSVYTISPIPQANSAGGADRQGIESIRQNAPSAFAAQQRLVTPDDYKATISSNFPTVSDISVWGGQDNVPIAYGEVYIGLDFNTGLSDAAKTVIKNSIRTNFSDNLSVMSITPVFVDPIETFLELDTTITVNPDLTSKSPQTLEVNTRDIIANHINTKINGFTKTFRRSNLLTEIDDIDAGILNSKIDVKVQVRLIPVLNQPTSYTVIFPMPILGEGSGKVNLESSTFEVTGVNGKCKIVNKVGSLVLQIINIDDNETIVTDNIGSYVPSTGVLSLNNFNLNLINAGVNFLKFSAIPQDQATIPMLRNFIFKHDSSKVIVNHTIDRQGVRVTL